MAAPPDGPRRRDGFTLDPEVLLATVTGKLLGPFRDLEAVRFIRSVLKAFAYDGAGRMAAAIAFYAVFSVIPFLLIVVPVVGLAFGETTAKVHITAGVASLLGAQSAATVGDLMERAANEPRDPWVTATGVVVLLYGGSRVFRQLRHALNTVWNVRLKEKRGWKGLVEDVTLPVASMVGLAAIILASITFSTTMTTWSADLAARDFPFWSQAVLVVRTLASALGFSLLFMAMFKYLPDVRIQWRDVVVGGAVTGVTFEVAKWGIGAYLARSDVAAGWGPAAFLVLFLMWVYLTALLVMLGAEFTQVYANRYGGRLEPEDDAYFVGPQWGLEHITDQQSVRRE